MKLRNKKTGKITKLDIHCIAGKVYESLAELNEEWEDVPEEPKDKDFWFFDEEGIIRDTKEENWPEESVAAAKEIGNYFETKEEAEKAVEKLKAWKRLKDKGFRFTDWSCDFKHNEIMEVDVYRPNYVSVYTDGGQLQKDLDLLFGGEE